MILKIGIIFVIIFLKPNLPKFRFFHTHEQNQTEKTG